MKKFWLINLLIGFIIWISYIMVNKLTYGTKPQFVFNCIFFIISVIQIIVVAIYALRNIKKHTINTGILGLFVIGVIILISLFIFNASFWDTDTGQFIEINMNK